MTEKHATERTVLFTLPGFRNDDMQESNERYSHLTKLRWRTISPPCMAKVLEHTRSFECEPCNDLRVLSDQNSQATMTVATALFMLPTVVVFPMLLRLANTPPASVTIARRNRKLTSWYRGEDTTSHSNLQDDSRIWVEDKDSLIQDDFNPVLQAGERFRGIYVIIHDNSEEQEEKATYPSESTLTFGQRCGGRGYKYFEWGRRNRHFSQAFE